MTPTTPSGWLPERTGLAYDHESFLLRVMRQDDGWEAITYEQGGGRIRSAVRGYQTHVDACAAAERAFCGAYVGRVTRRAE